MSLSSQMMEEWKFSRALRVPCGRVRLKQCVIRALSSYSSQWVKVPLTLVPIRSPYPSVQTCGVGHSGPLLRCSLTPHCINLDTGVVITVLADSDSILSKVSKKFILLLLTTNILIIKVWMVQLSIHYTISETYMELYPYPSMMEMLSIFLRTHI